MSFLSALTIEGRASNLHHGKTKLLGGALQFAGEPANRIRTKRVASQYLLFGLAALKAFEGPMLETFGTGLDIDR
jgi:hypothetical protein